MLVRGGELAAPEHGHAQRPVRLDEVALPFLVLVYRLTVFGPLPQREHLHAEVTGFLQVCADEIANPKPPRCLKDMLIVLELSAEFQSPQVVLLNVRYAIALGSYQGNAQRNAERQLRGIAVGYPGVVFKHFEATPQMCDCLEVRPSFRGTSSSLEPELNCGLTLASFSKVVGQELRLLLGPLRINSPNRGGEPGV